MKAKNYITCSNLFFSKCITSTAEFGDMKDLSCQKKFLNFLNLQQENLITANQIHSNNIAIVDSSQKNTIIDNCDGLITADKNIILGIFTADCMPVFMISDNNDIKGVIHSGWKGLASGILENAISVFGRDFGIKPENLKVYIGPHIKECCYEVGKDFESTFNVKLNNGKLNLSKIAENTIRKLGVKDIFVSPYCTFDQKDKFFSYRRDQTAKRQINIV